MKHSIVYALGVTALVSFVSEGAYAKPRTTAGSSGDMHVEIVGGTTVKATDPVASSTILIVGNSPQGQYICSGSIIAPDIVVTAAHCVAEEVSAPVPASQIRLVFNLKIPKSGSDPSVRKISDYRFHPSWKGVSPDGTVDGDNLHDIAIISFSGGLPRGYAPAKILPKNVALTVGESVLLAGYGITNARTQAGAGTLRKVTVQIQQLLDSEVVVDESHRKGSCSGDSGGPAFATDKGTTYLFGVTSRGDSSCAISGVYTDIPAHADFVAQSEASLRRSSGSALAQQ